MKKQENKYIGIRDSNAVEFANTFDHTACQTDPHFASYCYGFDKAMELAVKEIQGWIDLHVLNHEAIMKDNGYSFPKEAQREHDNNIRGLECIKSRLSIYK